MPSRTLYPRGILVANTQRDPLHNTGRGYLLIGDEHMVVLGDGECECAAVTHAEALRRSLTSLYFLPFFSGERGLGQCIQKP